MPQMRHKEVDCQDDTVSACAAVASDGGHYKSLRVVITVRKGGKRYTATK